MIFGIDFKFLLYLVGGLVAAYLCFAVVIGLVKGWASVGKIWFWTKKIWWILVLLVVLYFIVRTLRKANKKKHDIETRIKEVEAIESKTEEDKRELAGLENERKKVEEEIVELTKKYSDKVNEIKEKPDQPKLGDAAKSSDDLTDVWK